MGGSRQVSGMGGSSKCMLSSWKWDTNWNVLSSLGVSFLNFFKFLRGF